MNDQKYKNKDEREIAKRLTEIGFDVSNVRYEDRDGSFQITTRGIIYRKYLEKLMDDFDLFALMPSYNRSNDQRKRIEPITYIYIGYKRTVYYIPKQREVEA